VALIVGILVNVVLLACQYSTLFMHAIMKRTHRIFCTKCS